MDPPRPPTYSVKRAAQVLGIGADQVRSLIRNGVLSGVAGGRALAVTVESVDALIEKREAAAEARRRGLHGQLDLLADTWSRPGRESDSTH